MKASITSIVVGAIVLAGATTAQAQSITDTEGFPRLPGFFRNCDEPLPRYCVRPPGLLWFGSIATVRHEHRAASFLGRRVGSSHSSRHPAGSVVSFLVVSSPRWTGRAPR